MTNSYYCRGCPFADWHVLSPRHYIFFCTHPDGNTLVEDLEHCPLVPVGGLLGDDDDD